MEFLKLGKIIDNHVINVHIALHKLEEVNEELRKSLKRRKEIAIAENDIHYKDIDTSQVFSNGDSKEFGAVIEKLMEKNRAQVEEIRLLKLEQESQAIMLCEVTRQKKRAIEYKAIIEYDMINIINRLEEKTIEFKKISHM